MIEVLLAVIGLGIFVREIEAEADAERCGCGSPERSWFPLVRDSGSER